MMFRMQQKIRFKEQGSLRPLIEQTSPDAHQRLALVPCLDEDMGLLSLIYLYITDAARFSSHGS